MHIESYAAGQGGTQAGSGLKEVVLGLHWDPPAAGVAAIAADLDALCVLMDREDRVLEVIHAGHARNANGSVVHTGDSRTGASAWDDERIFVFLEALPAAVASLVFVVASVAGHAFHEVPGAYAHLSDRLSENEWVRLELTPLDGHSVCAIATLRRAAEGWSLSADSTLVARALLDQLDAAAGPARRNEAAGLA